MNLEHVQSALASAMQTGKLGEPVAARVHVQLVPDAVAVDGVLAALVEALRPCFGDPPARLQAREHPSEGQSHLLLHTENGRTISVTIGCGAANAPSLNLLVIGNRGVVRLEGTEAFTPDDLGESPAAEKKWAAAIAQSVRSGQSARI